MYQITVQYKISEVLDVKGYYDIEGNILKIQDESYVKIFIPMENILHFMVRTLEVEKCS